MQITSKLVKDEESLRKLVEVLMAQDGPIGFDIETGFVGQLPTQRTTDLRYSIKVTAASPHQNAL